MKNTEEKYCCLREPVKIQTSSRTLRFLCAPCGKKKLNHKVCKGLRKVRNESICCVFDTNQYKIRFLEVPLTFLRTQTILENIPYASAVFARISRTKPTDSSGVTLP